METAKHDNVILQFRVYLANHASLHKCHLSTSIECYSALEFYNSAGLNPLYGMYVMALKSGKNVYFTCHQHGILP